MVAIGDRHVAVGAEVEPEVPPICSSERSNQPIRYLSELRNRIVVMGFENLRLYLNISEGTLATRQKPSST